MPSMVWTCFAKTDAGPKCLLCNDLRKRRDSSTKTMWVHLKLKHLEIYQRLRNTDSSSKPSLSAEGTSKSKEMAPQVLSRCNNLLVANCINNLTTTQQIIQQTMNVDYQSNSSLFQNMALSKFFFELYAQLFTNPVNCFVQTISNVQVKEQPSGKTRYDSISHWPENGLMQSCAGCSVKTSITCKTCNVGLCFNCFQQFHLVE